MPHKTYKCEQCEHWLGNQPEFTGIQQMVMHVITNHANRAERLLRALLRRASGPQSDLEVLEQVMQVRNSDTEPMFKDEVDA